MSVETPIATITLTNPTNYQRGDTLGGSGCNATVLESKEGKTIIAQTHPSVEVCGKCLLSRVCTTAIPKDPLPPVPPATE